MLDGTISQEDESGDDRSSRNGEEDFNAVDLMEKIRCFWKINEKLLDQEEQKHNYQCNTSDCENLVSTADECSDESAILGKRKLSHNLDDEKCLKRPNIAYLNGISSDDEILKEKKC
jgi:hypothetical protein